MNKIIIIVIIALLLLPTKSAIQDLSTEEFDAFGIAGALAMVASTEDVKPEPAPNEPCKCKNGKVSHDGGTSLTDCQCKNSDQNCGCKKSGDAPAGLQELPDLFPRTVMITQPYLNGKPNCPPCIVVERDVVAKLMNDAHKKAGWDVGKEGYNDFQMLDLNEPTSAEEIERLKLDFSAVPTFFFITKTGTKKYVGNMSYKAYIEWAK